MKIALFLFQKLSISETKYLVIDEHFCIYTTIFIPFCVCMKSMTGEQLRKSRSDFWVAKKHKLLPEASLVGGKESTAMFNIAGMQQLIPYLNGKKHPLGTRLFNIQKCIRTVDIDEVGDASHLTFFEMMGNRSLGDYFKKDSVNWSREFLVDVL